MIRRTEEQKNRRTSRYFLGFLVSCLFIFTALPALADGRCADSGGEVGSNEAGVFMQGICAYCWELGTCQLEDFMQVFANVATYILSIVGSLALLVFVIGGFYWMISQGDSGRVTKGKDFMKGGVIGLLIVFSAYLMIESVRSIMIEGRFAGTGGYEVCGADNDGASCGTNMACLDGFCETKCFIGADQGEGEEYWYRSCSEQNDMENCQSGEGLCPTEGHYCCYD
jgi:hypothetical protein